MSFSHASFGARLDACRDNSAPTELRVSRAGPDTNREPFPCALSSLGDFPLPPVRAMQPCTASNVRAPGCGPLRDTVRESLNTTGKTGQKIFVARARVLDILQSENACTQWYRTKDPDPAATFRTLSFEVDRKGGNFIVETRISGEVRVFHNPYVARVIQGDGSYATITLNEHGAFFSTIANVEEAPREGGTLSFRGVHPLQVGPYAGNTLTAQVLTLLHEFGHLLELLPIDEGDRDGKSMQNSMEVLRYCRSEIESFARNKTLFAAR